MTDHQVWVTAVLVWLLGLFMAWCVGYAARNRHDPARRSGLAGQLARVRLERAAALDELDQLDDARLHCQAYRVPAPAPVAVHVHVAAPLPWPAYQPPRPLDSPAISGCDAGPTGGRGAVMNRMNRRITRRSLLPRAALTGTCLIGLGWVMHAMPDATPGRVYWPWLLITGVLLVLGVVGVWRTRRRGSAGLVNRWARKGRRNHGLASPWAILRVASALAMRRKTSVLRPGLQRLGWRRWLVPASGAGHSAGPGGDVAGVVPGRGRDPAHRGAADRQDRGVVRADPRCPRRGDRHLHPHGHDRAHCSMPRPAGSGAHLQPVWHRWDRVDDHVRPAVGL